MPRACHYCESHLFEGRRIIITIWDFLMTSGLPDNRSMWMRAFYGFGPEHDGYVGWTKPAGRDRILREIGDGDLILIYGSGSAETEKTLRSYVLGFVQVDARPIMDVDKASPDALKRKADRGWRDRWTFGIPVRRAWRADEKLMIRDIAFRTYRPEAGQGLGVWGAALDPDEIAQALKIRVSEVNVWGEPPVVGGVVKSAFGTVWTPSKAFPGSSGTRTSIYEDGETFLYLARFDGGGHALVGRSKGFGKAPALVKIGVSNDPVARCAQLNSGFPPGGAGKWMIHLQAPFPDRQKAEVAEQFFKDNRGRLESLGGEFFWGDRDDAESAFARVPGVSRFGRG